MQEKYRCGSASSTFPFVDTSPAHARTEKDVTLLQEMVLEQASRLARPQTRV